MSRSRARTRATPPATRTRESAVAGDPLREDLLESLSTLDLASLVLAVDELGYQRLGGPQVDNNNDFTAVDRVRMVQRSRLYWHRDPLVKQAVRLYVVYALGQGVSITHTDKGAQKAVDGFLADPANARFLGDMGRRLLATKLLVDGELFLALFTPSKKSIRPAQVRPLDPLEITAIITNPEDYADVWYFQREWSAPGGAIQTRYYRAAFADWGGLTEPDARQALGAEKAAAIEKGLVDDVLVLHVPFNTIGQRGYPLVTPSLDWSRVVRIFNEDRATLTRAASQFAFKKTVKGGPSKVQDLANALRNAGAAPGMASDPGYDRRGPIPGATLVQNAGVDTEWFKADTGAAGAVQDGRMLKLMFLAGIGIPEHYFADSANGNLATTTSMERPVELTFAEFQLLFLWTLTQLLILLLTLGTPGYKADGLAVEAPPILNVDVPKMLTALTGLGAGLPAFNSEPLWREILSTLGVKDIDAAIKLLEAAHAAGAPDARATGLPVKAPPAGTAAAGTPEDDPPAKAPAKKGKA